MSNTWIAPNANAARHLPLNRVDAVYARQSADRADSISVESQIEFCVYETRGAAFEVFADRGYSGKNTQRPEFQRMIGQIKAGKIKRVICYKLDRCSRSILDFTALMEFFRLHDVEFVSCTEKFDTSSPMGRAMLNICIVFAQLERETIQQRVYDAYHARCKHGFYMGGRLPFGYRLQPCRLDSKKTSCYIADPAEAPILYQLYEFYAQDWTSLSDTIRYMHQLNIKNPRREDGAWIRSQVGRLLRNPIYVKADLDVYYYFKSKGILIQNPPEDFIGVNGCYLYTDKAEGRKLAVLGPHEGIISSEIWLSCRKKGRDEDMCMPYGVKHTWLAGRIKCAKCGYAMILRKRQNTKCFVCSMSLEAEPYCSGPGIITLDQAENSILPELKRILGLISMHRRSVSTDQGKQRNDVQMRIARLEAEAEALLQKLPDANQALFAHIQNRITSIEKEIQQSWTELREKDKQIVNADMDESAGSDYGPVWERLTLNERLCIVHILIRRILVYEDKLVVEWEL